MTTLLAWLADKALVPLLAATSIVLFAVTASNTVQLNLTEKRLATCTEQNAKLIAGLQTQTAALQIAKEEAEKSFKRAAEAAQRATAYAKQPVTLTKAPKDCEQAGRWGLDNAPAVIEGWR